MKTVDREFVERRTMEVWLHDGGHIVIRPVVPEDKRLILTGFERLSEESRYRRFMGLRRLTEKDLVYLTEIDYVDHFALVALDRDAEGYPGVGVARYVRLREDPESAEAAIAVIDDHQGRGIGTILLTTLGAVALENGIRRFVGYVLNDNRPALDLVRGLGARIDHDSQGLDRMMIDLPKQMDELKGTSLYAVLRAVARGEAPVRGKSVAPSPAEEPDSRSR